LSQDQGLKKYGKKKKPGPAQRIHQHGEIISMQSSPDAGPTPE